MSATKQQPTIAAVAADPRPTGRRRRKRRRTAGTGDDADADADKKTIAAADAATPGGFVIDTRPSESLARLAASSGGVAELTAGLAAAAAAAAEGEDEEDDSSADSDLPDATDNGDERPVQAVWRDDSDEDADAASDGKGGSSNRTSRRQRQRRTEFLAAFGPTPHYLDVDRLAAKRAADAGGAESDEDEDESTAVQVLAPGRAGSLPPRRLAFERLPDANKESASHRRLASVRFNPRARVLLTASTDQRFALFRVDTDRPVFDRLHSHHMPGFPVLCGRFTPDGNHVVLAGVHRSFKVFDIMAEQLIHVPRLMGVEKNCKLSEFEISPDQKYIAFIGKFGEVYLVDFKTRNRVCTLRSDSSSVQSLTFSPDGERLFAGGSDGRVSQFSLRHNDARCVGSFADEGSTGLTSLAASHGYLACGSSSGVVNLYTWDAVLGGGAPHRTAMNLTTECSCLTFNATEELLLFASRQEPQAVRLWHLASGAAVQNFPPPGVRHYLAGVHSADFSPRGGFLCLGQHTGRAALFRLTHYPDY